MVARLLNEKAIARVQAAAGGRPVFKASHAALLPHLDYQGVRVTTLAELRRAVLAALAALPKLA